MIDRFLLSKTSLIGGGAFGLLFYCANPMILFNSGFVGIVLMSCGFLGAVFVNTRLMLPFTLLSCLFFNPKKFEDSPGVVMALTFIWSIINIIALYGTMESW